MRIANVFLTLGLGVLACQGAPPAGSGIASAALTVSAPPPAAVVTAPPVVTSAPAPIASGAAAAPSGSASFPSPSAPASADAPVVHSVEFVTGGANPSEPLPLVIALHGYGDSPAGFSTAFTGFAARARVVLPHSDSPIGEGYQWFPLHGVGAPEDAEAVGKMADAIVAFARDVARARPTLGKPIIAGFSQGGALSYTIAARHPGEIAAALPVSGWFPHSLLPRKRATLAAPVYAFHGTLDSRVPVRLARQAKADLLSVGVPVTLLEFEGVEHTIPAPVRTSVFEALTRVCNAQK